MTPRFLEILNRLHDNHVKFVIVGGVAAALHGGQRVTFDLDIVPSLAPESDHLLQRAKAVTVEGRTFFVASIDDLIEMKRQAGRPQDLLDISQLEDIKRRTSQ